MRRVLFFILSFLLFYVAGMYHYLPLMVLAVVQIALLVFLTVHLGIWKKRLTVSFDSRRRAAVKGETLSGSLRAECPGRFPLGKIRYFMDYGYETTCRLKNLRGDCSGESGVFSVRPALCGLAHFYLRGYRVYDYLFIGSAKRKSAEQMQLLVFPREQSLRILFSPFPETEYEENLRSRPDRGGTEEFRQLREYLPGDSVRRIHWKVSARTEALWVREYEDQENKSAELFLDLRGFSDADPGTRDRFYVLLSALILGLLQYLVAVRVIRMEDGNERETWNRTVPGENGHRADREWIVRDADQCRGLLADLYFLADEQKSQMQRKAKGRRLFPERSGKKMETGMEAGYRNTGPESLILDLKLCLYQGGRLLYHFSEEFLEKEIEEKQFSLSWREG